MNPPLTPTLTQLRDHVARLHMLLSAPRTESLTWTASVAREWQAIGEVGIPHPPVELALCEASRLCLKPDTLYRFTVKPGCKACEEAAAAATLPAT